MRYPPGHKSQKRQDLLQAAAAVLKERGFAATGVDAIAQAAGVTSGAFYSHFASKSELLEALIAQELQHSAALWQGKLEQSLQQWLGYASEHYLSLEHVKHADSGCVLPALGAEIARADPSVKAVFADELHKALGGLAARLGSEQAATAVLSQLVGAMVLARAMPTRHAQQAVLQASQAALPKLVAPSP